MPSPPARRDVNGLRAPAHGYLRAARQPLITPEPFFRAKQHLRGPNRNVMKPRAHSPALGHTCFPH